VALSAFDDKSCPPADRTLREVLGDASALWTRVKTDLQLAYGPLAEEWHFAGKSYGWSLRLKQQKRTLVHMTPCRAYFLASLALGDKACHAARSLGLPRSLLDMIQRAPKYVEGRGVRIPIRRGVDVEHLERLTAIKLRN
jgi:uncharacterized protein DUF3788